MTDSVVHIFQEKAWYFLSIYYSRDKWAELISQITKFYDTRQKQFSDCLIFLSEERGEHIRIALVSPDCTENHQNEIAVFFQSYFDAHLSSRVKPIPYGQVLWCDYPNNKLVWDRFRIWNQTEQHIRFHQKTFRLAFRLLEDDFSFDNVLSCVLYLAVKGLICFDPDGQNRVLLDTLNTIFEYFRNDDSIESLLQSFIDGTDKQDICETIESYWIEDVSDYLPELTEWLNETASLKEDAEFESVYLLICKILGLDRGYSILVLKFLDMRQKHSHQKREKKFNILL
jgi:hypothetical protein